MLRGQVDGLLEAFASVPDPRQARGVRFPLVVVLGLAQLAVACGAVGFDEIAEVAGDLDPELTGAFGLVRSAPSAGTFRRVLNATCPVVLDEALCRWAEPPVPEVREPGVVGAGPAARVERVVSADGKTMRAARRRLEPGRFTQDQVVEVLDQASGVVLACQEVEGGDEIGAVGQVMTRLVDRWGSLAGVVLVADAKHTQHKLVDQINDAGGWWVLPVKENQPGIHTRVTALPWSDLQAADVERSKGHGRQETRTIRVIQAPEHVDLGLAGVAQVIKIGRHILRKKNLTAEHVWTREYAYFLARGSRRSSRLPARRSVPTSGCRVRTLRRAPRIRRLRWSRSTAPRPRTRTRPEEA